MLKESVYLRYWRSKELVLNFQLWVIFIPSKLNSYKQIKDDSVWSFCTKITYTKIRIIHPIFSRESCDSPFLSAKILTSHFTLLTECQYVLWMLTENCIPLVEWKLGQIIFICHHVNLTANKLILSTYNISPIGSLQLLTQGSADIVLDACSDYWDGSNLCPVTAFERWKQFETCSCKLSLAWRKPRGNKHLITQS